jgi:cobalamin biosynthesis Mg chelatase CobN
MANLATAPDRAQKINGQKSAARLYNDIEYELALGDPTPEQEAAGEDALRTLEGRFPGIKDQAREVDQPPAMSRTAKRNLHEGRTRSGNRRSSSTSRRGGSATTRSGAGRRRTADPSRSSTSSSSPPPSASSSSAPSSSSSSGPTVSSIAGAAAGAAGAGASWAGNTSWGTLALDVFMGGVLLSFAVLLLKNAKGTADLMTGAQKLVSVVVNPTIDPLNPKGA